MANNRYYGYVDPSFQMGAALGSALGNIWANNAKKRQERKLDNYIDEQRNADFMHEIEAEQQPVADRNLVEARQAMGYDSASVDRALDSMEYDLAKGATPMLDKLERKSGIDRAVDNIANADAQGAVNFMRKQEGMTEAERAMQKYRNLTPEKVTAWARENDINREVLDARLPSLKQEVAGNVGMAMIPDIYRNLYSGNVDGILSGLEQVEQLRKYDAESADMLRKGGIESIGRYYANQNKLDVARAKAEAQPFTGRRTTTKPAFNNSTADMNMAIKRMEYIDKIREGKLANDANYKLPPTVQAEYDSLKAYVENGWKERGVSDVYGKPEQPQAVTPQPKAPNPAQSIPQQQQGNPVADANISAVLGLFDNGAVTPEEVLQAVEADYGADSESYKYVAQELQKRTKHPASPTVPKSNGNPLANGNITPVTDVTDEDIIASLRR